MFPSSQRLLEIIASTIEKDIAPALQTPASRETARLIGVLLAELRSRHGVGRDIVQQGIVKASGTIADAIRQITDPRLAETQEALAEIAASLATQSTESGQRETYVRVATKLADAVELAGEIGGTAGRAIEDAAADWERELLEALLAEQTSLIATESAAPGVELTSERVQDWLDKRAIFPAGTRVTGPIRAVLGGFSKGTFIFNIADDVGRSRPMVIRRNEAPPIDPNACFLQINEFRMMQHFYEAGIRIPKVIAFEPANGMLGGDATLMEGAPGDNVGNVLAGSGITTETARDMATVLASIHALDVRTYAQTATEIFGPEAINVTVGERNRQLLEAHYAYWKAENVTPSPIVARVFNWLKRNLPDDSSPACFIHGDFGLHNLLFENDRVSAVLDWETTQIGDPAQELAYLRDTIAPLMPWETFVSYYEQAGGRRVNPASLQYHLASRWLRNAVISDVARRRLEDGSYGNLSVGWLGTTIQPQFILKANTYASP